MAACNFLLYVKGNARWKRDILSDIHGREVALFVKCFSLRKVEKRLFSLGNMACDAAGGRAAQEGALMWRSWQRRVNVKPGKESVCISVFLLSVCDCMYV